jgi:hypothetical protein
VFFLSGWATFWIWRARRSGWSRLAAVYASRPREGRPRRFQTVRFLPSKLAYARTINVQTTMEGLMLRPIFFCRFGHEPLLVPWDDIEIFAVDTYPAERLYDLRLAAEPHVRLRIGVKIAQAIRRAADNARYFIEPSAAPAAPAQARRAVKAPAEVAPLAH